VYSFYVPKDYSLGQPIFEEELLKKFLLKIDFKFGRFKIIFKVGRQ
jgi:hypothetical protein